MAMNPWRLEAHGLANADLGLFRDNLESTYVIRLFAEFESTLRNCWKFAKKKKSQPATKQLIDSFASHQSIPDEWCDNAHAVREFRNAIVHEHHEKHEYGVPMALHIARRHLCQFVSRLPLDW
jgi:hypothetical protein